MDEQNFQPQSNLPPIPAPEPQTQPNPYRVKLAVACIVVIALLVGAYFYTRYQAQRNFNEVARQAEEADKKIDELRQKREDYANSPANIAEQLDMSNWKTYRNEEYRFEMRVPKTYDLKVYPALKDLKPSSSPSRYIVSIHEGDPKTQMDLLVLRGSGGKQGEQFHQNFKASFGSTPIEYGVYDSPPTEQTRYNTGHVIIETSKIDPKLPELTFDFSFRIGALGDSQRPQLEIFDRILSTFRSLGSGQFEGCILVVTRARNPQTDEEKDFPTPCDIPAGWVRI